MEIYKMLILARLNSYPNGLSSSIYVILMLCDKFKGKPLSLEKKYQTSMVWLNSPTKMEIPKEAGYSICCRTELENGKC